jgi:hypothetical protein
MTEFEGGRHERRLSKIVEFEFSQREQMIAYENRWIATFVDDRFSWEIGNGRFYHRM